MVILGLSYGYHDSAAALLRDGRLVAAIEEERLSRRKHDRGFPHHAIRFCLESANIQPGQIDAVAFYERPLLKLERTVRALSWGFPRNLGFALKQISRSAERQLGVRHDICSALGIAADRVLFVPHHLSHAASAFYCSGFSSSAILTIDGVGEWSTTTLARGSSQGDHRSIEMLGEVRFPASLGLLYSAFTEFCGFEVNEGEYKLMGLAPYGQPRYLDKLSRLVEVNDDGSFALNMRYFDFLGSTRRTFSDAFIKLFGDPSEKNQGEIDTFYADIAASVQRATEDILLKMANHARIRTGERNICLAGGVALNSLANGRICRESDFDGMFIQPAAGDSGGALGAALHAHCVHFALPCDFTMTHASWGKGYTDDTILQAMKDAGLAPETFRSEEDLADATAGILTDGGVVGFFQGRCEWGPRALGNRSIIADPRSASMKERINAKVKFRETFRPFAPAILEDRAREYFQFEPDREKLVSRYMLTVHPYLAGKGEEVGAVNHMGTGRVQTVGEHSPDRYRRVIEHFQSKTGVPIILNTSFNLRGEPIVTSPQDALRTFNQSGIDALVIGSNILRK